MDLRHLIDFYDMSTNDWDNLYDLACDIKKAPGKYSGVCSGKIMATLFYEPSTRTQLSFQSAMLKLGGSVIGFADPNSSSVSKGESLRDTIKIVSGYSDILVMRNPKEGAAYAASLYSPIPLVNAGDGSHLHPTQTMADMFTIKNELDRYENLTIGLSGDLLNGRTVHSLIKAFSRYKNNKFYFISTKKLGMPLYIIDMIKSTDNEYYEVETIGECIGELDILYMTRIQRERFDSEDEYLEQKISGGYILKKEHMEAAKSEMIILHPLPKVDEIEPEIDDDPRAMYFRQAENGVYVRMALVLMLLEANRERFIDLKKYKIAGNQFCSNNKCITHEEKYLPELTINENNICVCRYCEHLI